MALSDNKTKHVMNIIRLLVTTEQYGKEIKEDIFGDLPVIKTFINGTDQQKLTLLDMYKDYAIAKRQAEIAAGEAHKAVLNDELTEIGGW